MVNLLPTIRLAQSILKRKYPSVDKPLRIKAPPKISPSKGPLKNASPGAYFRNFTVPQNQVYYTTLWEIRVGRLLCKEKS